MSFTSCDMNVNKSLTVVVCSFDELLIGAPLYTANLTEPETGRVFLYRNNGVL